MTRNEIVEAVDEFWKARVAGDKAAVMALMARDAEYEMPGARGVGAPESYGPGPVAVALDRLVDDFTFHSYEQRNMIVEGAKAAAVSLMEVSYRGGPRALTEICDVWEFDRQGKISSLKQFVDTDLVRRMMIGDV